MSRKKLNHLNIEPRKRRLSFKDNFQNKQIIEYGNIYTIGQGDFGQLGLGENINELTNFKIIENLKLIKQIQCGGMHTIALDINNIIYSWGCNDDNALGRDNIEFIPLKMKIDTKYIIKKITAGDSHTAVLTECGNVLVCGIYRNSLGKIGLINKNSESILKLIYKSNRNKAVDISSGNDHILILINNGTVLSCGSPEQGQLGRISKRLSSYSTLRNNLDLFFKPNPIKFPSYKNEYLKINKKKIIKILKIFTGCYQSFAIDENGMIFCWGLNNYGQLGLNQTILQENLCIYHPTINLYLSTNFHFSFDIIISSGEHHTIILENKTGKVYSFGKSDYGLLGIGEVNEKNILNMNLVKISEEIKSISTGDSTNFIITKKGILYSWGFGGNNQLGNSIEEDINEPKKVNIEGQVFQVSSGGQHSAILVKLDEVVSF